MKDYTVVNPSFQDTIQIPETTDTNHADNINHAPKQIFENTLVNQESIASVRKDMDSLSEDVDSNFSEIRENIEELTSTVRTQNIFRTGTDLTSGQDLNDVTDYGRYNSGSASISASLVNAPVISSGFALFVFPSGGQRTQFVIVGVQTSTSTMDYLYMRNMNSSGTWTSWYAFSGTQKE